MTEVSKGGLALAKAITPVYSQNPKVQAVMLGGSVSRGCADVYSDLDIAVFWVDPASVEERKAAIAQIGGELWSFDRSPGIEHYGLREVIIAGNRYTGTAMVSAHHVTVAEVEQSVSDVVDRLATSLEKQGLISAIQQGIPLYGVELLLKWQTRANAYPQELAIKMVQENLWFGPWFCPEAYVARDDLLVLHQHFLWVEQGMLKVLAGLNHIYYPSTEHKWMDQLIGDMRIAPSDLSARLKQVLQLDPLQAWRELRTLIDETLSLLESHLPEVDAVSLFESHPEVNIGWARRRWEPYPPYSLMRAIAL